MLQRQCVIDSHPALADMLSRVKRFAAPVILLLPAPVWLPAASAAASVCINVKEWDRADA
jgi:hypothetical protein